MAAFEWLRKLLGRPAPGPAPASKPADEHAWHNARPASHLERYRFVEPSYMDVTFRANQYRPAVTVRYGPGLSYTVFIGMLNAKIEGVYLDRYVKKARIPFRYM